MILRQRNYSSTIPDLLYTEFRLHIRGRFDSLDAQHRFNANLAQRFARFFRDVCRHRNVDRLSNAPCWNNARSPGSKRVQISSSVSGEVAITATRSSGVVYFAKSIDMSASIKCAVENGQLRTR